MGPKMSRTQSTSTGQGRNANSTGQMRSSILHQLNVWESQTKWADQERADRLFEKINNSPKGFISPNPSANYREEASRIWDELKDEYGLRSETDLSGLHSEWEERAERHYQQKQEPEPEPDTRGAPEPRDIPEPEPEPAEEPEPAPEPDEATDEAVEEAIGSIDEPEPEPAGATDEAVRAAVRAAERDSRPEAEPYTGLLGTLRLYLTWLFLTFVRSDEVQEICEEIETLRLNFRYYLAVSKQRYRIATGRPAARAIGGNQS